MTVVEGNDELLEEPASQRLWQATFAVHKLVQVAPRNVLHNNGQMLDGQEALPEADDVRMAASTYA